ncbi:DUF6585 family protein [Nocardia sp. NPDC050712]|uniref:DUF6585 family protein n=1 Tax=Nocardia sp. NPDC050712 TaxID=3155518 RepID=UPI0033FDB9BE
MATPNTLEQDTGETDDARTVPLSQLIHLMSEYQKLGTHRQTYLPAPASDTFVRGCGIVIGCCVVLGVICVAVGAPAGGAAAVLFALVPAIPAAWRARSNRQHRSSRLDLFDFGMTVYRSGERIAGFRWDTAQVKQRVIPFQSSSMTEYAFEMSGPGAHATFDDTLFSNGREWGKTIQSAITATQLPNAVAAIDNEETMQFGDLALNLDALIFRGNSYPWERIQLIDARSGLVRIKFDGRWISLVAVASIPNFYIFNELAERLRVTDPI